jgi:hypothetical protein
MYNQQCDTVPWSSDIGHPSNHWNPILYGTLGKCGCRGLKRNGTERFHANWNPREHATLISQLELKKVAPDCDDIVTICYYIYIIYILYIYYYIYITI